MLRAACHRWLVPVYRYLRDTHDAAIGVEKFAQTRTYIFFGTIFAPLARLLARKAAPVVPPVAVSGRTEVSSPTRHAGDASDVRALPVHIRKNIFRMLPASHRFVAPVCRQFRDDYAAARVKTYRCKTCKFSLTPEDAARGKAHRYDTCKLSLTTEDALRLFFREERTYGHYHRQRETSLIGAGCGRTDWVERGGVFDARTCLAAAKCGQLDVLRWLRLRDCPWDKRTCAGAARQGHLRVLKWARVAGCPWDLSTSWGAASNGHLRLLMWARGRGCPWNEETCWVAADRGHVIMLHWLRMEGCPWNEGKCAAAAAAGGHLEVLKWIWARGCPIDEKTCHEATKAGNMEMFMWLRKQGCSLDRKTSWLAAQRGNLELLKWLRKEGCPWDENTCEEAAVYGHLEGHLEVLKWAIENGCKFREDDLANIRNPKFFEWFEEHHNKREREMLEADKVQS